MKLGNRLLLGATVLACVATASSGQPENSHYRGSNISVDFPKGWEFVETTNHREVYAVPEQEERGGIYVNNAFEPSGADQRASLTKTHAKYVKNGQAKSEIKSKQVGTATYIWFDFKAPVRKYETYTKGYMIFSSGHSVLIHTVRLDKDKTIGKEMDSVVATVKERSR